VKAVSVAGAGRDRAFRAEQVLRVSRVVEDLRRAERFYGEALDFRTITRGPLDAATRQALRLARIEAEQLVMRLGEDEIALVQFFPPGARAPRNGRSNDRSFQHLAIVVRDMAAADAQLNSRAGWTPISAAGPERLPAASGGVRAFKFRDPDRHPLELIWFPRGQGRALWRRRARRQRLFLGIDHTALAVTATRVSLRFYAALGLGVAYRSRNRGAAQSRLDHVPRARVAVVGLRAASPRGPGIELLAYDPPGRPARRAAVTRLTTDWISLVGGAQPDVGTPTRALKDPDGHRLLLLTRARVPATRRSPDRRPSQNS
jgi:catechol 2,3-dioxygenase-like lactoylglutathione lyase family enzyme